MSSGASNWIRQSFGAWRVRGKQVSQWQRAYLLSNPDYDPTQQNDCINVGTVRGSAPSSRTLLACWILRHCVSELRNSQLAGSRLASLGSEISQRTLEYCKLRGR